MGGTYCERSWKDNRCVDFESTGVYDLLIKKLSYVLYDVSHPLHNRLSVQLITRSGRMRLFSAVTSRYLSSFVLYRI